MAIRSLAKCFFAFSLAVLFLAFQNRPAYGQAEPQTCLTCHKDQAGVMDTKHGAKGDPASPAGQGQACTGCHGISKDHINNPSANKHPVRFSKGAVTAQEQTRVCMGCHAGNRHLAFWETGRHARNDVRCNDCHAVHTTPTRASTIAITKRDPAVSPFTTTERQLEYETCIGCHKQVRVQINKPSHHPIMEGKVTCSSCHNPHGAQSHAMVKHETVNIQCWSCHADKRGPYLFQHPAVEENCLSCHSPHGSSHTKLLNERVPNLCQDCHDWSRHPGTAYSGDQGFVRLPGSSAKVANTRFVARSCLNCHNAIHGSNAPATRGKYLTR
ncbi:MAG: DmsE family decaheme c-type cytochrome [Acidobacteriota bacterium]|nr:DmsE family decaheme c-type cytochrome [Acidobacteriota bacterium]